MSLFPNSEYGGSPLVISDEWNERDLLALSLLRGMNSTLMRTLVENSVSLDILIEHPPAKLERLAGKDLFETNTTALLRELADNQLEDCARNSIKIISLWSEDYPKYLRAISYPPSLLFVRGTLTNDRMGIGIVGTRKVTQYGKLCTEKFATSFTEAGAIVVSGLATGVDTYAHQATIKAKGITYAVIASGIDCLSPSYAQKVADEIVMNGGAIISEYRCGVKAMPAYFPQRNRIISGISSAVVVVESGLKGGSLITAQFAIDQYKELYAVPGNITSERSAGTNKLIQRNLAKPALSPDDVLLDLDIAPPPAHHQLIDLNEHEAKVYTALSGEAKIADQLADELSMNINDVLVHLLMLEFKNVVVQLPGKQFIKRL